MYVLITLVLLVLTTTAMVGLRLSRSSASYSWLTSSIGALLAWISILAWQLDLPRRFNPSRWAPTSLFYASPELLADPYAWLYALSLAALAAAVILTSPARAASVVNPAAWAGTLALAVLGLLAILADNPLTLVLGWTAIDLTEFLNTLRASDSPALSERTVVSFAIRAAGTGLVLWASVISALNGRTFLFENATSETGFFLLLAVGLRLGVLPLHLTYRHEPVLRRGFGTALRLTVAATSLILLARLPASALNATRTNAPYLLILVAFAALYGGWKWLFASDELSGRPYWIIGMGALSLSANLRGSSAGSAAWGTALVLFGGISFLYSARHIWYTRTLAGLGILLLALPFSLTSTGWTGTFPWPALFWPLFLAAHFMLVAGYIRHLFRPGESLYVDLPTWAQTAYPIGLALLALTAVLTGFWGWPGAMQVGIWVAAIALVVLGGLAGFSVWRFKRFAPEETILPVRPQFSRFGNLHTPITRLFWAVYRLISSLFSLGANLLEGDGGLLWTLLLLVLFITIFRGR
jgi:hypothetical protein